MFSQIPGLPSPAKEPVTTQISGTIVASGSSSQPAATAVAREREKARALNREGSRLLAMGKPAEALEKWEEAEKLYRKIGDRMGIIGSGLNQAQAWEALGHYTISCDRILVAFGSEYKCEELTEKNLARELDRFQVADESLNFKGLQSLGNMLRRIGKLEESQLVLTESKDKVRSPERLSQAWLNLGNTVQALGKQAEDIDNTEQAKGHYQKALECYQKAVLFAKTQNSKLPAQVNLLNLKLKVEKAPELSIDLPIKDTRDLLSEVKEQLDKLRPSQMTVYARINLACSLIGCDRVYAAPGSKEALQWSCSEIEQLLTTAIEEANILQNQGFQSLAIGTLGTLYEKTGELPKAESMTEKALELAKSIEADDIAYQWEWQMGRLLKQEGDVKGAIAYYIKAVNTLEKIGQNLIGSSLYLDDVNLDIQFSFQDKVEPVYRELIDLLLQPREDQLTQQNNIKTALTVIELLQVAELENYLKCELDENQIPMQQTRQVQEYQQVVERNLAKIHKADDKAAVIYPIILPDRIEVILSLPGSPLSHHQYYISDNEVKKTLKELERILPIASYTWKIKQESHKVYKWLIRPLKDENKLNGIDTLVFGLDTLLRNIPMSVLYASEKYLVETYNIAVIPRLQLQGDPKGLQEDLEVLTAGLIEPPREYRFSKLPYVDKELSKIKEKVSRTKELRNRSFTSTSLRNQIKSHPFPVVHLATHGQFSSTPNGTFILASDGLININQLASFLQTKADREPIELLVLSACKTAEGDRRAALGLAGVAVKAGASSTIGSLWSVPDKSTAELIGQFYQELVDNPKRAEALRNAQLYFLKSNNAEYRRPRYWAPFVLVGNWF